MFRHLTRSAEHTFGRLSLKKLLNNCDLKRVSSYIDNSTGATSYFATSFQCRKYVNSRPDNSDVNNNNEDEFRRSQKDSWTGSFHLEHSALGLLGWTTALAIGWCMSQPFLRKCILPSDRNKWDKAALSHNLAKTVFTQPSAGINKASNSLSYGVPTTTIAQLGVEVNKNDIVHTEISSHSVENSTLTVQEALDKATDNLAQIQNALAGAVDNKHGIKHMLSGKKKLAAAYFLRSAELGNRTAMFNTGICYEMGLGIEKDLTQAASYYCMAAKKGHPTAAYNLGVFHMYGLGGVVKDLYHAQELFKYAASLGQREAKEAYNKLSSYLDRKQRFKQCTNEPPDYAGGTRVSESSPDKKAALLMERLSSNVLNHKSKHSDLLVPASNAQASWSQEFINLVSYVQRPR